VTDDRATWSYDDKRMSPIPCACGRLVSNGTVCAREGCCVVQRRADQIAKADDANLSWHDAAMRVGEALSANGPDGYYAMTPAKWRNWALAALASPAPQPVGSWAKDDPRRLFVDGAAWWEFTKSGGTMWPSDRDRAEAEAERRYPAPAPQPADDPVCAGPFVDAFDCPKCDPRKAAPAPVEPPPACGSVAKIRGVPTMTCDRERVKPKPRLEKHEQNDGVRLLRSLGAAVYVLGTKRRAGDYQGTMQTPGIPDVHFFIPCQDVVEFAFWEVKRSRLGRISHEQADYAEHCHRAGIPYICGDLTVLMRWLVEHGYLRADQLPASRGGV
jgi:hypothetical protein